MVSYKGSSGNKFGDYVGKSTDVKPTNAENGDTFYEMDGDHRLFMFDEETKTWLLQ